jgi:PLP dependent protein
VNARRAELAANLAAVDARLRRACRAAGRDRDQVTLVAVTKTWPAADVRVLADLGVRHIGENRDQEAAPKAAACADLRLSWHFLGRLQTNKCRSVATYASMVHSVDRPRLVDALGEAATRAGRVVDVLLQVSLDADPAHGGALPAQLPGLAAAVTARPGLRLAGVMAVAPLPAEPAVAFARLAEAASLLRAEHPAATVISAGMSGDLEAAVAAGATHVRVGTALLGRRPPLG